LNGGSAHRKAATYAQNNTDTELTHTQTFMSRVRFEPKIPLFERTKTVHALDRAATVIGNFIKYKLFNGGNVISTKIQIAISPVDHCPNYFYSCPLRAFLGRPRYRNSGKYRINSQLFENVIYISKF
jgi:hypothetical protein